MDLVDNTAEERFELRDGDRVLGFAQYRLRPGLLALIHTEIDESLSGQGLASKLIRGVLDEARARHLAVLPFCPFVNAYIEKHPEYVDLVPVDHRERFGLVAS